MSFDLNLFTLVKILLQKKLIIVASTFVFVAGGIFYSLSLPNIYQSYSVLAPAIDSDMSTLKRSQLGSLASIAGVLPSSPTDKTQETLEILKSKDFLRELLEEYDILPYLMASKSWDSQSNSVVFDDALYNEDNKQWVRDVAPPKLEKPSLQEAYLRFAEIFSVTQSRDNGMVTISIKHVSPYIAQQWNQLIINKINNRVRSKVIQESETSIEYLRDQIKRTEISDLKLTFYELIKAQTEKAMLANTRPDYVFRVIDPPLVPELKIYPRRTIMVLMFAFAGIFLSSIWVILNYIRKLPNSK